MLVLLLLPCLVLACGGPQSSPGDSAEDRKSEKKTRRKHAPDKDAVSEDGKKWGGWRWKGKRDECYYVFKNRCYDTKAEACSAAKCGKQSCAVKEGAPSKVSCKK